MLRSKRVIKVELSTVSSHPLGCAVISVMDVVALSPHHDGV